MSKARFLVGDVSLTGWLCLRKTVIAVVGSFVHLPGFAKMALARGGGGGGVGSGERRPRGRHGRGALAALRAVSIAVGMAGGFHDTWFSPRWIFVVVNSTAVDVMIATFGRTFSDSAPSY